MEAAGWALCCSLTLGPPGPGNIERMAAIAGAEMGRGATALVSAGGLAVEAAPGANFISSTGVSADGARPAGSLSFAESVRSAVLSTGSAASSQAIISCSSIARAVRGVGSLRGWVVEAMSKLGLAAVSAARAAGCPAGAALAAAGRPGPLLASPGGSRSPSRRISLDEPALDSPVRAGDS